MGGDLAPNLGGTKKFFRGPISGKISIFRVNISDDLFLVIDLVLRIFPFFSHLFRMFTMLNVVYDHFLTRKTQFFTLLVLSRTSDNTTSQNIGGAVPPPQILRGPSPQSPQSPLGLRPCVCANTVCMYACIFVYVHVWMYACIHICMYICLYIYTVSG